MTIASVVEKRPPIQISHGIGQSGTYGALATAVKWTLQESVRKGY